MRGLARAEETDAPVRPLAAEPARPVTLRALCVGLAMSLAIVWLTQAMGIAGSGGEVGGGAPPPAPTYLLFLYALVVAPLLGRVWPALALSRGELLLVYAMVLVSGPITHQHAIGFLIPHTVSPLYYNAQEPGWAVFRSALPAWFGPSNAGAVKTFFEGGDGSVPWGAWLVPMAAWGSLLIALFFVMLCVNVLLRRQWVDHERLTFPLTALPLALADGDGHASGAGGAPSIVGARLLKQPLFWLGLALPLLVQAPSSLHRYFPGMPDLRLRDVTLLDAGAMLSPPWKGLGRIEVDVIFWLVGIAYLLPKEITLSAWVFYLIRLMENVAALFFGKTGEEPNVYSNDFPALFAQGAGAALALTALTLWSARHHLAAAARKAFRAASGVDDSREFLSYRTAFLGAVVGIAFILAWLCLAGMRLWVAGLFLALMLAYFLVFARIRAEAGLGMGVILWPKMLDEVIVTLVGGRYLRLADLTVLYAMRWLYFGSATGAVMACQLEGFKLADAGGLRGRRVGWALASAATLTVGVALVWTLSTYYARGFQAMHIGQRITSMVGSQIYWSYQDMVATLTESTGPDWHGIWAIGAGGLVTLLLGVLRLRFLWFPLHPVGYLAANSWGIHITWVSFLTGWLLNMLVTRYGGLKTYRHLLPLFLGLVVGDMLHEGVWGIVTWMTGTTQ